MKQEDLERNGEVWVVTDPFEVEDVIFDNVENALAFVKRLTEDLELNDSITISFKAVRMGVASDVESEKGE